MPMSDAESHFEDIVVRAWRNYLKAETDLNHVRSNGDESAILEATKELVLTARTACIELHQFADTIATQSEDRPRWLPADVQKAGGVRRAISEHCRMLGRAVPSADLEILHDIADAFKHSVLTRAPKGRDHWVRSSKCHIIVSSRWDEAVWDQARWDEIDHLVIVLETGDRRSLTGILQNVIDAWSSLLRQELPDFSE